MRYSTEPRDRIFVKGFGYLSFLKNLSAKYIQYLSHNIKHSATDALKITSKNSRRSQ